MNYTDEIRFQLGKIQNEEEYLSIIVMILHEYFSKYPKRDFNNTISLIKKGYMKFSELLKED